MGDGGARVLDDRVQLAQRPVQLAGQVRARLGRGPLEDPAVRS
jgi:hypothetical protein